MWSLGTILTGFAATFALMVGFRVLVGFGEASYATISPSLISDSYPRAKRNNALTIFYVAIPVGAALGNIIGGAVFVAGSYFVATNGMAPAVAPEQSFAPGAGESVAR